MSQLELLSEYCHNANKFGTC